MMRIQRMVVVALAAVAMVLATSTAAQAAEWTHVDGFDNQPQLTWGFVGTGGFELNVPGSPFTPPNNAWIRATTGWSSVGKSLNLPATGGGHITCDASIQVRAPLGARVNFEIIRRSDWTYVALRQATVSPSTAWQPLVLNDWDGGAREVFVRVALIGQGTRNTISVDHLFMHCDFVVIE